MGFLGGSGLITSVLKSGGGGGREVCQSASVFAESGGCSLEAGSLRRTLFPLKPPEGI